LLCFDPVTTKLDLKSAVRLKELYEKGPFFADCNAEANAVELVT
jgi:hypothetical protein